jgi:hypothetical protein
MKIIDNAFVFSTNERQLPDLQNNNLFVLGIYTKYK